MRRRSLPRRYPLPARPANDRPSDSSERLGTSASCGHTIPFDCAVPFDHIVRFESRTEWRRRERSRRAEARSRLLYIATSSMLAIMSCVLACLWASSAGAGMASGDTAWRTASSMQSSPRNKTGMTNETGMTVDEAQAYNRRLIDSGQYDLGQPDAEQQNGSGDSGTVIGRILIPAISTDLPIRQSSDAETLRLGAGLLHDTSLPVGGLGSHAVITAHSGLPDESMFSRLDELGKGDLFYLKTNGDTLAYRVAEIQIIDPTGTLDDFSMLRAQEDRDLVSLLTCTGMGNTRRLLVTGVRNAIPSEAPEPQDAPQDDRSRYMGFMPTIPATTIPPVTFTHAIGTELQRLLRNRPNSLISRHATRTTASASSRQSPIPTPSNGTLAG